MSMKILDIRTKIKTRLEIQGHVIDITALKNKRQ